MSRTSAFVTPRPGVRPTEASGGGKRSGSGGGKGNSGMGSGGSAGGFSWDGGRTGEFNPEQFGQMLGSDATTAYSQGPAPIWQGNSYAGLGGTSQQSMQGLLSAANRNSGAFQPGIDFAQGLIAQGGQQSNPYLDQIINQTNDSAYTDVMASMGSAGRQGSSLHADTLGRTLANNESNLRYGDYQQGISNAMGAAQAMPGLFQSSLMPSQVGLQVGALQDADRQATINADRERFDRLNDPAYQHLAKYIGLLGQQQGAAPQPEKQPGLLDWIGTIGSIGVGLL